jgi:hypothetical protein
MLFILDIIISLTQIKNKLYVNPRGVGITGHLMLARILENTAASGPPSPDSTDPKISAFSNVTFTLSRSSTVRTLDRRTS